ncbi:MAG: alpha/beta hydrolase-fold protein [Pseudomonadota bacterium]
MFRKHDLVPSQHMDRPMHLWRYGHYGPPVLVLPSAAGMAHEWEAGGMIDTLGDWLREGRVKLYCTESNVAEGWTRKDSPPEWRIRRHMTFERYIVEELVPLIREDCESPNIPIAVTGTSMGAFFAANLALKHPRIFSYALCMSGRYNAMRLTDGFSNEDVYFNNPMAYVGNMGGAYLDAVREHTHITLVCGQGKWENGNIEDTQQFGDLLAAKGISAETDLWGHDVDHDWAWWRRQVRHHFARALIR